MADKIEAPHKVAKYDILNPNAGHEYNVVIESSPRRVRVMFNGETVADSIAMKIMHETKHLPIYYFPVNDVRTDLLQKTDHTTHCPYKGDASYWNVSVGERTAENAVWSYEHPIDSIPELEGLMAFYWDKMDHWHEEDEEIFVHLRDPYHRIDTTPSSRHVQVMLGGEIVADTRRATFLFETRLPTRYYIPREDVRFDLLGASGLTTACPYKGRANYYSVTVSDKLFENILWTYHDPVPECPKIKDLLCFFNENVDKITVDDREIPKQMTHWSKNRTQTK
jgi:uncharacterized protein (DUF427 family)